MAQFGGYETVREIYQGGPGAVYVAKGPGGEEKIAVKVFQPPPWLADEERVELESVLFLEAATAQQGAANAGSASWAPVHGAGRCEGGAWYATDLFDRSAEKLILQRRELDARELHRIVEAAVNALADLKKTHSRPHGNFKPTNVLVTGRGENIRVGIADPMPASRVKPEEDFASDLRGIGDLIHQLVLHKPMRSATAWPALSSPEWQRLGKAGEHWLALCNHLLEPTAKLPDLDEVVRAVGALKSAGQAASKESLLRTTASMRSGTSSGDFGGSPHLSQSGGSWVEGGEPGAGEQAAAGARAAKSKSKFALIGLAVVALGGAATAYMVLNRGDSGATNTPDPIKRSKAIAKQDGETPGEVTNAGETGTQSKPTDSETIEKEKKRLAENLTKEEQQKIDARVVVSVAKYEPEAKRLLGLINAGSGLFDQASDSKTIIAAYNEIASNNDYELMCKKSQAMEALEARVKALREISTSTDSALLAKLAATGPLAEGLAAWQRLSGVSSTWPATVADLGVAGQTLGHLKSAAGNADPRFAVRLTQQGQGMFGAAMKRISFATDADFVVLRDAMAAFGVLPTALADPRLRFNVSLHALKTDLAKGGTDEVVKDRVRKFIGEINSLDAAFRGGSEVASAIKELSGMVADKSAGLNAGELSSSGPAKFQWTYSERKVGERSIASYKAPGGIETVIEFSDITVDGKGVMISTTEVSIAMINAILEKAESRSDLFQALTNQSNLSWRGPKPWRVGNQKIDLPLASGGGENARSKFWLAKRAQTDPVEPYSPEVGATVRAPTLNSPFSYVTPSAAAKAAVAIGCRLPTATEWEAAVAKEGSAPANRRDRTWMTQHQYVAKLIAGAQSYLWPDEGQFKPTGAVAVAKDAKEAVPDDDKQLWFAPVSEGGGNVFHHLIGNMSEIVSDGQSGFSVIGASALSGPEVEPNKPYKITGNAASADVGFRLAFEYNNKPPVVAETNGLSRVVLASLDKVPYVK